MSLTAMFGLVEGARLTNEEMFRVLEALDVRTLTERIEGVFVDVYRQAGAVAHTAMDPDIVEDAGLLFDGPSATVSSTAASQAELCVLVPGSGNEAFRIARAVAGVEGYAFKHLEVAVDELAAIHIDPAVLKILRRAGNLGIAVVFGERMLSSLARGG